MLISDSTKIDEGELTVYILSKDDKTLCSKGYHTIMAIGPSFKEWPTGDNEKYNTLDYAKEKDIEKNRLLNVLEKRFPVFLDSICHVELSTPVTLQRLVMKEKGAVACPKQQLGQYQCCQFNLKQ